MTEEIRLQEIITEKQIKALTGIAMHIWDSTLQGQNLFEIQMILKMLDNQLRAQLVQQDLQNRGVI